MVTRARSRFGFFGNENNNLAIKENQVKNQKGAANVVTRSRAALGDIKNKGFVPSVNENKNQGIKKKNEQSKLQNACDMSIDENSKSASEYNPILQAYRDSRKSIRNRILANMNGHKYLDNENEDFGDTASVYPFVEPIFNYLQSREIIIQPLCSEFINAEAEVNPRMRYILVNWLVQVHHNYKLQPETLYLSIALLDRYLMKHSKELTKDCFQLVGIASLFVAAKFEEMYPPDISDFTAVTHNAFNKSDIRLCEQTILQSADFYLSIPIPLVYLRRLSRAIDADRTMHNLGKYLLELTIQEYELAHLTGNLRATVALCLSRAICFQTSYIEEAWCDTLAYLSGYKLDDIREPLRILARAAYRQNSPSKYRAIFDKYRVDDFYGRVAALPQLRSSLLENLADLKFDSDGELNAT